MNVYLNKDEISYLIDILRDNGSRIRLFDTPSSHDLLLEKLLKKYIKCVLLNKVEKEV